MGGAGVGPVSPSLRTGPLLIDPDQVRLPKPSVFGANQVFTRRTSPAAWQDDPILAATQTALLPDGPDEGPGRLRPRHAGQRWRRMTAYDWPRPGRQQRHDDQRARRAFNAGRGTFAGGTIAEPAADVGGAPRPSAAADLWQPIGPSVVIGSDETGSPGSPGV